MEKGHHHNFGEKAISFLVCFYPTNDPPTPLSVMLLLLLLLMLKWPSADL